METEVRRNIVIDICDAYRAGYEDGYRHEGKPMPFHEASPKAVAWGYGKIQGIADARNTARMMIEPCFGEGTTTAARVGYDMDTNKR